MTETKEKILGAAERLFAEQGYAATSLRHIIAEAGVNLAAIHYHFGSKQELLDELVRRKAEPVNQKRVEMLEGFEGEAGGAPVAIEKILEAFLTPMAERMADDPEAVRLIGRIHSEGLMPTIADRHFKPVGLRFLGALRRTVPALSEQEFMWRFEFTIGAMAHAMTGHFAPVVGGAKDTRGRLACLIAFLSGGFRAPATRALDATNPMDQLRRPSAPGR